MSNGDHDNEISAKGPAQRAARRMAGSVPAAMPRREVDVSVGRYSDRHYCPGCGRKKKDCDDCGWRQPE